MNDTILDVLALNHSFFSSEWNIVEACDSSRVNCEFRCDVVPGVLLCVELGRGLALEACKGDHFTRLAALGRYEQLSGVTVGGFRTEDHAVAHIVSKFPGFKVHEDYTELILHLFNGDQFLETGCDAADFTIADVYLLVVKFI